MIQKEFWKDKELLQSLALIGRLGLNTVISLLIFFFTFLYLDKKFGAGNILLIVGILLGIFTGVYINYKQLKRFYDK